MLNQFPLPPGDSNAHVIFGQQVHEFPGIPFELYRVAGAVARNSKIELLMCFPG
jgi:hypothetical protein